MRLLAHFGFLDLLLNLLLVDGRFILAQLPADGLELLTQIVLSLRLGNFILHFRLDFLAQLRPLNFAVNDNRGPFQPFAEVHLLEDFLLLMVGNVHHRYGPVGDTGRVLDVGQDAGLLLSEVRHHFDEPMINFPQAGHQCVDFQVVS